MTSTNGPRRRASWRALAIAASLAIAAYVVLVLISDVPDARTRGLLFISFCVVAVLAIMGWAWWRGRKRRSSD